MQRPSTILVSNNVPKIIMDINNSVSLNVQLILSFIKIIPHGFASIHAQINQIITQIQIINSVLRTAPMDYLLIIKQGFAYQL